MKKLIFHEADKGGGNGGGELQPGQTRETTVETKTPGTPEKDHVEKTVEHAPGIKHEGEQK